GAGQEVLVAGVRHYAHVVGRRPGGPSAAERGHALSPVVQVVRRRLIRGVDLVVAEDGAVPHPPQELGLVAAGTAGERASRVVSLGGGGSCHSSTIPRPRVKCGRPGPRAAVLAEPRPAGGRRSN